MTPGQKALLALVKLLTKKRPRQKPESAALTRLRMVPDLVIPDCCVSDVELALLAIREDERQKTTARLAAKPKPQ